MSISEARDQNKKAWEHRAYEFWNKSYGTPKDLAKRILENPAAQLKKHKPYFENMTEKKDCQPLWVKWQKSCASRFIRCRSDRI